MVHSGFQNVCLPCCVMLLVCGCTFETKGTAPSMAEQPSLFQLIVNVRDMNAQVTFYRDVLGLSVVYPTDKSDYSRESFVRLQSDRIFLALHSGRQSTHNQDEPRMSFLSGDLVGMQKKLKQIGVDVADVIRTPAPGVRVLDARDPEGNAFHLESHDRPSEVIDAIDR